jgi:hypothetical protein
VQLTHGGVRSMYTSTVQPGVQPVVQIIDIKKVQSQGNQQSAQERYRYQVFGFLFHTITLMLMYQVDYF